MFDIFEMFAEMNDPRKCVNCGKPLAEGDAGIDAGLPNAKVCTPCEEARVRLMNKVQEGITITYREGTVERIGGNQ